MLLNLDPYYIGISLAIVLFLALIISFLYYFLFFGRIIYFKPEIKSESLPPVSIIICARNEAQNLFKFLPLIFKQNYPKFQVVVINDCSWDESIHILEEFQTKHSNLHIINLKEEEIKEHDKKLALTLGIKGAIYEHLIFTDADCFPISENWIRKMASNFSQQKQIVIGYGGFKKEKGLLNMLIRFDSLFVAMQYFSAAINSKTYMGVGRNLAYTKSLFFQNKGFASHYHIQSGDDDLFINKVAKKDNVAVELSPESFTYTVSKKTWSAWFAQKRRHLSTSKFYNANQKFRLVFFHFNNFIFYFSLIALHFFEIIENQHMFLVLALFVKLLFQMISVYLNGRKLNEKDLWYLSPVLRLILVFVYPVLHFKNLFVKKHVWK